MTGSPASSHRPTASRTAGCSPTRFGTRTGSGDRWLVDIAPMLNDSSIKADARQSRPRRSADAGGADHGARVIGVAARPASGAVDMGSVGRVSASPILTGVFALLTLAAARSRGKALAALGVSALLVGAAGWAGLEVAQRDINDALNRTTGDIRQVADVMVATAEDSLHQWLNLTLAAGGVLVVLGIVVSMLGGLRRSPNRVSPCHSSRTSWARSGQSRRGRRSSSVRCAAPAPSTPIRPGPGTPTSTCGPATSWPRAGTRWTCSDEVRRPRAPRRARHRRHQRRSRTTAGWRSCWAAGSGRGSARRSASCFPTRSQRAGLLHLLLDDWVGAALVSGYAVQHAAITLGIEEKLPAGTADNMAGICAGFAPDASLVPYARRNGTIPSVHGPVAPPLDIARRTARVEPLRPHGMRRFRRLDLASGRHDVGGFRCALP